MCGLAQAIGLTVLDAVGFRPSIAFVSLQAACLPVGRLIASGLGVGVAGNLVRYDGLFGPSTATVDWMDRGPSCYCETRAETI